MDFRWIGSKTFYCLNNSQSKKMIRLLVISFCFIKFISSYDKYNLTTGCFPRDTCQASSRSRRLDGIKERNCLCDKLCTEYGDCCHDATYGPIKKDVRFGCHVLKQFGGVYLIDTCKTEWRVLSVQEKCHSRWTPDQLEDPIISFPITNKDTGITYKNFHCAQCNEDVKNLQLWSSRIECESLKKYNDTYGNITHSYVLQNLVYQEQAGWGLLLHQEQFYECMVDPVLPEFLENKIRLCIPNLVSECGRDWRNRTVEDMCRSYMGTVYYTDTGFRNFHCALCNHINESNLACQSIDGRDDKFETFRPNSFALLFDVNNRRGMDVGVECKEGQVYDIFFKRCRSLECSLNYVYEDGKCVPDSKGGNYTESLPGSTENLNSSEPVSHLNKSERVVRCGKIKLSSDQYKVYENRTVFVIGYNRHFNYSEYIIEGDNLLICASDTLNFRHNFRFSEEMGYATIIGLYLSIAALVLYIIIFCLCPDLQNLSGKNLISLVLSMLLANLFFIVGQHSRSDKNTCAIVGAIIYYFFMVSFFWMNVLAFDIWRTLRMATTELRVLSGGQWKRFLAYSSYAWLIAACIVSVAVIIDRSSSIIHEEYRPNFGIHHCWFGKRIALLIFFGGPVSLVMVINVILFTLSTRIILSSSFASNKRNNTSKRDYKLYLRLALIMGLSWISGIIAGFVDRDVVWFIFILLTTLQGFFIFVAFGCNKKVWNSVRLRLKSIHPVLAYRTSSSNSGTPSLQTNLSRLTSQLVRTNSKDV